MQALYGKLVLGECGTVHINCCCATNFIQIQKKIEVFSEIIATFVAKEK